MTHWETGVVANLTISSMKKRRVPWVCYAICLAMLLGRVAVIAWRYAVRVGLRRWRRLLLILRNPHKKQDKRWILCALVTNLRVRYTSRRQSAKVLFSIGRASLSPTIAELSQWLLTYAVDSNQLFFGKISDTLLALRWSYDQRILPLESTFPCMRVDGRIISVNNED